MESQKVLIVDDDARSIEFLRDSLLVPSGYTTLCATDGEEALHLALTEKPDLMLLDLQMPKMDGFDVLEALRHAGRDIPVILITAYGSETVAMQAFRLGVRDYFPKPFKVTEMMEAVERSLAEAHLRKEKEELAERLELVNRELEQRLRQLTILYGISKSVTSLLDLNKLLTRIVEATMYVTGAEEISLFLLDEETQELQLRAVQRAGDEQARGVMESGDDAVVRQVMTTGQVAMIESPRSRKTDPLQVTLAAPLKSRGGTIGVLHATTKTAMEPFSDNDRYVLSVLADYAAIAIENARLFQEVEEQRGKLETILTGTEDVILVTDENGRVLLMNPAAAEAFDVESAQTIGKPLLEVTGHELLNKLLSQQMAKRSSANREVPLPDGRTFYAGLSPIPDVGWALIMRDITHIKELDRMKSDFVATITHDLRSPLTSIQSLLKLLPQIGELNEEQQQLTARAMRNVDHMQDLIGGLLDIARIEAGVDMQTGPIHVHVVVDEAAQHLEGAVQDKELSLEVILPEDLSVVDGNHTRLVQVMTNLLDNAIKYTPRGGSIKVSAAEDEGQIAVYVTDTGVGIPASARPHIFDKFYRVQGPATREVEGVGLGLATAKSIVERHGGHVFVESRVGHGSTFCFTLPKDKKDSIR
ncbi:MAG: response regulator [Anaerolineae bacterium]|nr:response regulator [Anaerolineae bacterium]NIN94337.1 response regulator [Anaerolineae bacterium]NIQ77400.1 response regulator [Anaerolineae bacterium]